MQITLKLFAGLAPYLPRGAADNQIVLDMPEGTTVGDVLDTHGIPRKMCHLVLVNGVFVPPAARDAQALRDGDALAAWPPVAGG